MDRYSLDHYYCKMKFWKLFGNEIRIFDGSRQNLLLFVKQKAFKLKESITIYGDESKSEELMRINARSVIDFGASYDVDDAKTGQRIGTLRRKGLKSILRDSWLILDASENEIGTIQEDSMALAMVRRLLSNLVPQTFSVTVNGQEAAEFKQTFNPFVPQVNIHFAQGSSMDKRLGLAAAVLLQVIEGRQQ
ncbi:MAG: hypothetical protein KDK23_06935 [Leptospiraceae bacterium]|nr:hypothetical protein [Leptospiraceae bacterium]